MNHAVKKSIRLNDMLRIFKNTRYFKISAELFIVRHELSEYNNQKVQNVYKIQ